MVLVNIKQKKKKLDTIRTCMLDDYKRSIIIPLKNCP